MWPRQRGLIGPSNLTILCLQARSRSPCAWSCQVSLFILKRLFFVEDVDDVASLLNDQILRRDKWQELYLSGKKISPTRTSRQLLLLPCPVRSKKSRQRWSAVCNLQSYARQCMTEMCYLDQVHYHEASICCLKPLYGVCLAPHGKHFSHNWPPRVHTRPPSWGLCCFLCN